MKNNIKKSTKLIDKKLLILIKNEKKETKNCFDQVINKKVINKKSFNLMDN